MTKRTQAPKGRLWPLIVVPLLIAGIGLSISRFDLFSEYRGYAGRDTIPERLVQSGRTGQQLRLLEYLPLDSVRLEDFDRTLEPAEMPSSTIVASEARQSPLPTLSVALDSEYLLDRHTGLLNNYHRRGRSWERPAYASYFREGQLVWATGAGLRIHGGKSRAMHEKSFRLHFRKLYGMPTLSRDLVFEGPDSPLSTLVIHNDLRIKKTPEAGENWHYTNPVAYAIAERIGCIVPATQPVKFYLNGEYQGPYVLKERITADFLVARFGHDDFFLSDTKSDDGSSPLRQGSQQELRDLIEWPQEAPGPLTIAAVEQKVDLANLTNWFISVMYSATTDPFQGAVARDRTKENGRWFWINWDMDHAFMDIYSQVPHPWEIDNFSGASAIDRHKGPRATLFNRLRAESPEYRVYFLRRLTEVLNHEVTPAFMDVLVSRYEKIAADFGIEDRSFLQSLRPFARNRPAVLRDQMNRHFFAGASYQLSVRGDASLDIQVDSRDVGERYSGWYFADTPALIEIADENDAGTERVTWIVDGEIQGGDLRKLKISLSSDTAVEIRVSQE